MGMARVDARALDSLDLAVLDVDVGDDLAAEVAALQQHRLGPKRRDHLRRVPHVLEIVDVHAHERFRLGGVRGDDQGLDDEVPLERTDRFGVQQRGAALGHRDRVDDDRDVAALARQGAADGPDDPGVMEHAGLDGVGADIGKRQVDLPGDEVRGDVLDGEHALGALGGQRRDRGGGIGVKRGDRLDVALDTRAAAGIRPGDDENTTLQTANLPLLNRTAWSLSVFFSPHDRRERDQGRHHPVAYTQAQ